MVITDVDTGFFFFYVFFFFCQAEDGIRDSDVTGVQTCALPIFRVSYSKDGVDKALLNAAKREEALYNEFKASQAFDRLEKKFSGN